MPYRTCPACRLEAYCAAGYPTTHRCPRCATPLASARRPGGVLRRVRVADVRLAARAVRAKEVDHGIG